jgi:SpoVK/Ycf46/Vps4 family AAA+-type ATPase
LRRAGRFTDQIFIPPPDSTTRELIFKIHTKEKPIEPDVDFKKLAELTDGHSSADIKAIVDDAAEIPWAEAFSGKPERAISMADFLQAVKKRKSSLPQWFRLAQVQMEKSGERDLYRELWETVEGGISEKTK